MKPNWVFLIVALLVFASCKKDSVPATQPPAPIAHKVGYIWNISGNVTSWQGGYQDKPAPAPGVKITTKSGQAITTLYTGDVFSLACQATSSPSDFITITETVTIDDTVYRTLSAHEAQICGVTIQGTL